MLGTIIIMEHLLTEVLGKLEVVVVKECSVAVAGTAILEIVVVPGASITMPMIFTTIGVFGLSHLPRWFLLLILSVFLLDF